MLPRPLTPAISINRAEAVAYAVKHNKHNISELIPPSHDEGKQ